MADEDDNGPIIYCNYPRSLIHRSLMTGEMPAVTTDPNLLEVQAKEKMSKTGFDFIACGAGEGASVDANRNAFRQWKLVPRVLKATTPRDLSVTLFGEKYATPILMAPIGVCTLFHPDKEIGVASACAALRVPYTLSSMSSTSLEELVQAVPESPKWFQLYWPRDDDITVSLLSRAKQNGYKVLVVTLDTWATGWRPKDFDTANFARIFLLGVGNGLTDPVVRRKFAERTGGCTPEESKVEASLYWTGEVFSGVSFEWENLGFLRKHWDGPIVLKGILSADDAVLAAQHGMDGVIVSNHGGRQMDGCISTMDALPDIVAAVGDRLTVMIDSGFRTGADIIKALALGANGVFVGRPVIYGLGINGREGAEAVLAGLLAEIDLTMGFLGVKSVADFRPSLLRKIQDVEVKSRITEPAL